MTQTVRVTPAQVAAAKAVVAWCDAVGRPVSEAALRISNAETQNGSQQESLGHALAPRTERGKRAFGKAGTGRRRYPVTIFVNNDSGEAVYVVPAGGEPRCSFASVRDEALRLIETFRDRADKLYGPADQAGVGSRELYDLASDAADAVDRLIEDYEAERGDPQRIPSTDEHARHRQP